MPPPKKAGSRAKAKPGTTTAAKKKKRVTAKRACGSEQTSLRDGGELSPALSPLPDDAAAVSGQGAGVGPAADPGGTSFIPNEADREMALRAVQKRQAGQVPTRRESEALRRESIRRAIRSIPQKIWREASGRPTKVLNEQAERYGLPFGGPTVDLYALAPALHNFLARNKYKLAAGSGSSSPDADPLLQGDGGSSPSLERYRDERAKLARLERLEREGVLVSRETLRDGWSVVSRILRSAGESLQRHHGEDARRILDEALDDADCGVRHVLGDVPEAGDVGDVGEPRG